MTEITESDASIEPKRLGLLAQFAGPDELIAAAEKITDDGYTKVEGYSPFAVIGLDEALKAKGTILPWIVFCMGLTGCLVGLGMQLYMNGLEFPGVPWGLSGYDFPISGKPGFSSLPAFIPVTFECIILLSAFGSFFGMLILNQLPKLYNPLFRNERFADVTNDGFFLFVETGDPKYAEAETSAYLTSIGANAVDPIDEAPTGHAVPGVLYMLGAVAFSIALVPPLYIWATSSTTSTTPRISFFKDMESQAKLKAQTTTGLFADGIAARKPIVGTVARGSGKDDFEYYHGYSDDLGFVNTANGRFSFAAYTDGSVKARFVQDSDGAEPAEGDATGEGDPNAPPEKDWIAEFPEDLTVDERLMNRGEQRYNIHCAACHGLAGNGDGLVSQRALKVSGATWSPPTSLHVEAVVTQPVGRIFDTISNGRRKMPGYREHITPEDRWAIVLYIKALQRSQNATREDIDPEVLKKMTTAG